MGHLPTRPHWARVVDYSPLLLDEACVPAVGTLKANYDVNNRAQIKKIPTTTTYVLPYFRKSEKFTGIFNEQNKKYHNWDGSLNVAVDKQSHDFEHMISNAAIELGLKNSTDINGESQMGVMMSQTMTKNGHRFSTARAFLNPIKDRKNFHVIKHAQATKVLFVPGTNIVSGVMLHKEGKDIVVNVKKKLILSAGTLNSPHIRMMSGIGPRKHLEDMKIEVKAVNLYK